MGLNTIHDNSQDFMESQNLTNGTIIKGVVLDAVEYARFNRTNGIAGTKYSFVIRCNGWCDVSDGDVVLTPITSKKLVVVRILDRKENPLLFRHRKDINDFTGSCDIFLN